jgi:hypothetical protein
MGETDHLGFSFVNPVRPVALGSLRSGAVAAEYPVQRRLCQWRAPRLSRRVGKVVGYPPLCDMSDQQRREFHLALLEADSVEDLPGQWQAAILKAEQRRPKLRVVSGD